MVKASQNNTCAIVVQFAEKATTAPAKGHDARTRSIFAHGNGVCSISTWRPKVQAHEAAKRKPRSGGTQYGAEFGKFWHCRSCQNGTVALRAYLLL